MATTDTAAPAARYFNRDLSWVDFNERVLEEGLRKDLPLFERFRFLSIVASNFDEFFMVRVAAIKRAQQTGHSGDPSGLGQAEQLRLISEKAHSIIRRLYACLIKEIFPGLAAEGLEFIRPDSYTVPQMDFLESFFIGQIYPVITPQRIEADQPMPFFDSRCINAAFLLASEDAGETAECIVMVQLPISLDRIIWLPLSGNAQLRGALAPNQRYATDDWAQETRSTRDWQGDAESDGASPEKETFCWALLDDLILTWGSYLFPGYQVRESMLFKVNRDADFSVDEHRDED